MIRGKVLALDYGTKRIGIASGDFEHRIAFPRDVIGNRGDVVGKILALCRELEVVMVVVGLPLGMRVEHKENPLLKDVERFVQALRGVGLQVELFDERLSSFEARELMGGKQKVDAQAAQIILQRFFDQL